LGGVKTCKDANKAPNKVVCPKYPVARVGHGPEKRAKGEGPSSGRLGFLGN